ncbi:MAG: outer membrane lipoprotein-sorting protein [Bacteroidales bacterium]|nr:outer membrane lipoprotein-sorting protein [Bacteroidales bacterium]
MKKVFFVLFLCFIYSVATAQQATEIVEKANKAYWGTSSIMKMKMTIERPQWSRTLTMKSWSLGDEYSMILILSPEKEKGQVFLKRGTELWNWLPSINRMVKMPPSMMSQGWMGSDISNDDLLRQSSLVDDYSHSIVDTETIAGRECWKIELIPHENAQVMWGKILLWVSKEGYLSLKIEYYDEDMYLVHTERASNITMMDGREFPAKLVVIPADEPEHKTILEFLEVDFDVSLQTDFFSQQNMKKLR